MISPDANNIPSLGRKVETVAPRDSALSFAQFLAAPPPDYQEPFGQSRRDALGQLSKAVFKHPLLRRDPGASSLAYWLRPANVARLNSAFDERRKLHKGFILVPVGRVFHIAPSNVDTMFVYSWALSYLCGNSNIVRISGKQSPIVSGLIECMQEVMAQDERLREDNRFVTYEHDDAITEAISAWCTHRVIWGGNETIAAIRPLGLGPHAGERLFGSKFSYSVISADQVCQDSPDAIKELASRFFVDALWFDQRACSSTQVVYWVGSDPSADRARNLLLRAVAEVAIERNHTFSASDSMHRLGFAFDFAVESDVKVDLEMGGFVGIELSSPDQVHKPTCGGGLLQHVRVDSLADVAELADIQDQTVTHYGFALSELQEFARSIGAKGVDRVVPVGSAHSFGDVWDGYDLIGDLLKRVEFVG